MKEFRVSLYHRCNGSGSGCGILGVDIIIALPTYERTKHMRGRYKVQNDDKSRIVERLVKEKIAYWELGRVIGCHENTIARMLRNPTQENVDHIMRAIDKIVSSRE